MASPASFDCGQLSCESLLELDSMMFLVNSSDSVQDEHDNSSYSWPAEGSSPFDFKSMESEPTSSSQEIREAFEVMRGLEVGQWSDEQQEEDQAQEARNGSEKEEEEQAKQWKGKAKQRRTGGQKKAGKLRGTCGGKQKRDHFPKIGKIALAIAISEAARQETEFKVHDAEIIQQCIQTLNDTPYCWVQDDKLFAEKVSIYSSMLPCCPI